MKASKLVKRRGLMAGVAALAGAALAKLTGPAELAEAANGQPVILGQNNDATANTRIDVSGGASIALDVRTAAAVGVSGLSQGNVGVLGTSTNNAGVRGSATGNFGVLGDNSSIGVVGSGLNGGVVGFSGGNAGVTGRSNTNFGIFGEGGLAGVAGTTGGSGNGLAGVADSGVGVRGQSGNIAVQGVASGGGTAILGQASSGPAGRFQGRVEIEGDFSATGIKSALVPGPNGDLVRYYCVEAPVAYFEDCGVGRTRERAAVVRLDQTFVATVDSDNYLIYLTAKGPAALWVSGQNRDAFQVAVFGSDSDVEFNWRVVARRKDVDSPRLERVSLEPVPETRPVQRPNNPVVDRIGR